MKTILWTFLARHFSLELIESDFDRRVLVSNWKDSGNNSRNDKKSPMSYDRIWSSAAFYLYYVIEMIHKQVYVTYNSIA